MGKKNIGTIGEQLTEAMAEKTDPTRGVPTAESVIAGIELAMVTLGDTFREDVQKVRGDNGKLYPMDAELPADVTESQIETVNELHYPQRQVTSAIVWKLETMLEQNQRASIDAGRQLAWARKAVDEGKADAWLVESKQRFVDQLAYQAAIIETAFGAAMRSYTAVTGECYVTAAERTAQRIRANAGVAKAAPPVSKAEAFRRVG